MSSGLFTGSIYLPSCPTPRGGFWQEKSTHEGDNCSRMPERENLAGLRQIPVDRSGQIVTIDPRLEGHIIPAGGHSESPHFAPRSPLTTMDT